MTIDRMIERLTELRAFYGNVNVIVWCREVTHVEIVRTVDLHIDPVMEGPFVARISA